MPRIALIVTGELERRGLAQSLQRAFPDAEFLVDMKLDSFTSTRVQPRPAGSTPAPTLAEKLAAALVAAVDPGRSGNSADFALVIDDLDVCNLDQPDAVVGAFREAVRRHVNSHWPSQARRDRAFATLRERASFHLLVPMIESYFFANGQALEAAGVRGQPVLAPYVDLEDFTVADEQYLKASAGAGTWATGDRAKHPKRYLQYLIDPSTEVRYRETQQGVQALGHLDWRHIVRAQVEQCRFARSLLGDIADALQLETEGFRETSHPSTALRAGVLRNA